MLNILVLAAQEIADPMDHGYPAFLTEINGKTLLQIWIDQAEKLSARLHLAVSKQDIQRFSIRDLILNNGLPIILHEIPEKTGGATCTALLALACENPTESLLILNGNEFVDIDFAQTIQHFTSLDARGGVVYFESVHPRYSYIRLSKDGWVIQASEKTPISKNATAGFYWFSELSLFVVAAESQLLKDARVDGRFYICPLFNELILRGEPVAATKVPNDLFRPMKTVRQTLDKRMLDR